MSVAQNKRGCGWSLKLNDKIAFIGAACLTVFGGGGSVRTVFITPKQAFWGGCEGS
jgi:hypothetical protein